MFKRVSAIAAMLVTMLFVPFTVLGAGGGGEEAAHAEPSGLVMTILIVLSFATLIYMMYLMVTDNG